MKNALMSIEAPLAFWQSFCPTAFGEGRQFIPGIKRLIQPDGLDAFAVRAWLKRTLGSIDITPTEWARKAKLAPSTLNKFVKSSSAANLSATTISALAQALLEMIENDEAAYKYNSDTRLSFRNTWTIPTIALMRALYGPSDKFEWDEDKEYYLTVPVPDQFVNYAFSIEVGSSTYQDYPRGSVLICQPAQANLRGIDAGQRFILHTRDPSTSRITTSIRRTTIDPDGKRWLTRVPGDDISNAFFFEDILPAGYGEHACVSFLIVASLTTEKWIGSFSYYEDDGDDTA